MLYAQDFRKIARDALRGKWALTIGTGFVACLLGGGSIAGGGSGGGSHTSTIFRQLEYHHPEYRHPQQWLETDFGRMMLPWLIGLLVLFLIWLLVTIIIGGTIRLGYSTFNLNLLGDNEPHFSDIFSQFHRFGAGFCMRFLMGLYIFLWILLLIIPGVIASYSYAMTPYIMVSHPEYGANEAIGYSKELMRGHKWRLFSLHISFIGWELLGYLTLGIGFLWIIPYEEAATAAFYLDICDTADSRDLN